MRISARWRAWASHHRVHVGIVFALLYVAFSRTDAGRLIPGALVVAMGEGIRVWACGHLVRNEVLTRDGPYRHIRHPLYLGSFLIGVGLSILAQYPLAWLGFFVLLYIGFYLPAMYVEELRLQSLFGAEYQEYMEEVPRLLPRLGRRSVLQEGDGGRPRKQFSWAHAQTRNRELRTVVVMAALIVVQALKLL